MHGHGQGQGQRTRWHHLMALAVLGGFGLAGFARAGSPKNDEPKPLPPLVVQAWLDAGAWDVGWIKEEKSHLGWHSDQENGFIGVWHSAQERGLVGAIPA